jgi:DNA-binding MarR family transcriptional regulator
MKKVNEGGYLIAKIHRLSGRIFGGLLKRHGIDEINPAQGRILFTLWQEDDIPIQELAKRTMLKKSTMTSMLDRLEEAGHLTRAASANDRRKIHIRLTRKNKALHKSYLKVSEDMARLFYDGFSHSETAAFEKQLKRVLENLARRERSSEKST